MNNKKLLPLFIIFVGLALVIAAIVVWLEPPEEGGLFSTAGSIISFLAGLGTTLKGWKDLLKKDSPTSNSNTQEQSQSQEQQQVVHVHNYPPNSQSPAPNHSSKSNTLPHLPFFFGRVDELKTIAGALAPESRTWGALIDGPGGIGKTALAIKAAQDADEALFKRKIFITAKVRELKPDGEKKLTDFTRASYLAMLEELGKELGEAQLEKLPLDERPNEIRLKLAGQKALIVFDNLETLPEEERTRLFQFLSRLPDGNKAIVTSRRRSDVDARIVRLDRLNRDEAMQLIDELALRYSRLARASETERNDLYEITGGNPLFIRWIAGQLGRERSQCRTIAEACAFIEKAPKGNDPLEYIFGDLLETFTENETKVLAALTHFTQPAKLSWLAQMTELPERAAETALDDLTERAILTADEEARAFYLPPLARKFIATRRPEAVNETGDALANRAYALVMQHGGETNYEGFPKLDAEWELVSAALPRFLAGDNRRLQDVSDNLTQFFNFTGRWDDWIWLMENAEKRALVAQDKNSAGWNAYRAGWVYYLRNQADEVLACVERAADHWQESTPLIKTYAIGLRGHGYRLNKDYPAAITAYREALEIKRTVYLDSDTVSITLNDLAGAERENKDYAAAERHYREALRIAKKVDYQEGIAYMTGNLAELALDREQWAEAEALARESLTICEKIGTVGNIAYAGYNLSQALLKQGKQLDEAFSLASHAADVFTRLGMPKEIEESQEVLAQIEGKLGNR